MSKRSTRAYAQMDFEMVQTAPNFEVPSSKPAVFEFDAADAVTSTQDVQLALEKHGLTLIAPYTKNKSDGAYYLSSKLYLPEPNEFLHMKASGTTIRLFPKSDEYSVESIETVLDALESELGISLDLRPEPSE